MRPPPLSTAVSDDELLPLIIGITGHRDLREEDIPRLVEVTRTVIRGVRERYPHTPLVVLSPLGEGADRLVARVGLEEGARLIVPLPLPRDIYEKTFADDASRREFAEMESRAAGVFTLPWLNASHAERSGESEKSFAPNEAQIEAQYAAMGAYMARHSHVFLALWNGDDAKEHERVGGTAQIVRFRLHGAPPPFGPMLSFLEREGYGSVHHIATPRQSRSLLVGDAFSCRILPDGRAEDFSRLDGFNADILNFRSQLGATAKESVGFLVGEEPSTSSAKIPLSLNAPLAVFGWSDTLSTHFSRHMTRAVGRIFQMVFLAALCFNLFHSLPHPHPAEGHGETSHAPASHATSAAVKNGGIGAHAPDSHAKVETPPGEQLSAAKSPVVAESHTARSIAWNALPWFLWLYLALVVLNVAVHRRAEKRDLQNKYQDYRALAEGLRVQIYWRMVGLREEVTDHYLGKQRGELNWIHNAIQSCNVLTDAAQGDKTDDASLVPLVIGSWVRDQRNYYVKKTHREQEGLERSERNIKFALLGSIGLALLLGLVLTIPSLLPVPFLLPIKALVEAPLPHAIIMIVIVMLAVTAGLLHGHNEHFARAEHVKRFGRMGLLFQHAYEELDAQQKAGHWHQVSALLRELGREALVENGDWVLLHRERPMEVPHAG